MEKWSIQATGKLPITSFSFTMSTGIISISALIHNEAMISTALFFIGLASLLSIFFLYTLKIVGDTMAFKLEFHDKRRFFGFFTISAAVDVISTRLMITNLHPFDYILFVISVGFLVLFSVVLLHALFQGKLQFSRDTVTSDWLNVSVALEASAISISVYYQNVSPPSEIIYMFTFALVLAGLFSYASVNLIEGINLIKQVEKMEFNGMFFINMGAGAILSLASLELLMVPVPFPSLLTQQILNFLFAAGGIYATLWLPVVLYRYFRTLSNVRAIRYRVSQWAIIFPLGMYSVTTHYLSRSFQIYGVFNLISYAAFVAALSAWALECIIAARHIIGEWNSAKEGDEADNPS